MQPCPECFSQQQGRNPTVLDNQQLFFGALKGQKPKEITNPWKKKNIYNQKCEI